MNDEWKTGLTLAAIAALGAFALPALAGAGAAGAGGAAAGEGAASLGLGGATGAAGGGLGAALEASAANSFTPIATATMPEWAVSSSSYMLPGASAAGAGAGASGLGLKDYLSMANQASSTMSNTANAMGSGQQPKVTPSQLPLTAGDVGAYIPQIGQNSYSFQASRTPSVAEVLRALEAMRGQMGSPGGYQGV